GLALPVLSAVISLVTVFGVMLRLDAGLLPYSLLAVPLMAWALVHYRQRLIDVSTEQQTSDGAVYDRLQLSLTGIPVIHVFQAEERSEAEFRRATGAALAATVTATRLQLRFKVVVGASTALATAAIMFAGAHQALAGRISLGGILVFLAYLDSLYAPLHAVTYSGAALQGAAGSARRLLEVLDAEPEVRDRPGARAIESARGHVVLREVTFGYEEGHPVLQEVSVEAKPGQTVAIVGPSGAGKTTLVSLVPRLFDPWSGQVLLDGHDLRDLKLASLRQQVSVVLQESFLFPVSIAENISYGRPSASRAEVEEAARAANAHEFIMSLPDGYDTVVGERGGTLSGGERQRVAIARALLKDAPVLILDEPTSALDAGSEHLLLEALGRLMAGRTTLIIAHRLSTVRHADQIVVLVDGRVAEAGSHAELMALAATYAEMHDLQHRTRRRSTGRRRVGAGS
ncbi:MAG TPA: ABC transporter ATP-binding protein, partial [Acidimicrobiales bacterium]|nr:ABC transporter ATP-binding protein [Acidimicrobiales bacterium]